MSEKPKNLSVINIKAKADGRTRVGVCAVFGNVDSYGDRIHPGAFTKTIQEQFTKLKAVRHLWMHDGGELPVAEITELRELSKNELPAEVIAKAPDATGGLLVARKYLNTIRGNDTLECVDAGVINEMSFAYDVVKSAQTEEETDMPDMPKRYVRELLELRLYDTSDVTWGANSATIAIGAKNLNVKPLGVIVLELKAHEKQMKAGARNSATDLILIQEAHDITVRMEAICKSESDNGKTDETNAKEEKAEAVTDTSLSELKQSFNRLKINNLKN